MLLPIVNELSMSKEMIEIFKGYNHNFRISDSEFYDMQNLSSDDFPVLSPRKPRGIYQSGDYTGLIAKDALCYVDGTDFVVGEYRVPMELSRNGEMKTLVSMGAYVIIMPDKKYVNTADLSDFGNIENTVTTTAPVSFSLCTADAEEYDNITVSDTAPSKPENMALWLDTASTPHTLKQYSEASEVWVDIPTTYVKISSVDIGKGFSEGDGVSISGITDSALFDLNGSCILHAVGDDYIVITGILDTYTVQSEPLTISRRMPNMDFLIESENRLWGCRYGTDREGNIVNEIYASKLGDFKNWDVFLGISTDSYAATVGTDGAFTGAIAHLGYPLFFKETCMHKIYGSYPANFQIQTTACRGVQKGSSRSLAIVGETLFYKSRNGVCAYDGALPSEISESLGDMSYHMAVGGSLRHKYYISMRDDMERAHLFVYDTTKRLWHREDALAVKMFCECRGELYFIAETGDIGTVLGSGEMERSPVSWFAETGILGTDSPDKKYISRLDVRMRLEVGSCVRFFVQYDSDDTWEHLFTMTGEKLRSFTVPIRPRRCDHLRLRIEGIGKAHIFSICKTVSKGE